MEDGKSPFKIILFLAIVAAGYWAAKNYIGTPDTLPWRKDLDAAKREAAQVGKPLLVYFTADWCGPCQEMKKTTWADPRVAVAIHEYIPVKIDVDEQADVAKRFNVSGIPRIQMLLPNGQPGQSLVGYISPDETADWLK